MPPVLTTWMGGIPPEVTAQQKGQKHIGYKVIHFEKKEVKAARKLYEDMIKSICIPEIMGTDDPVMLEVVFCWPWRAGDADESVPVRLKSTKPDYDNATKLFQDVLFKHIAVEDSRIALAIVAKYWGHYPGIGVRITKISDLTAMAEALALTANNPIWFVELWDI